MFIFAILLLIATYTSKNDDSSCFLDNAVGENVKKVLGKIPAHQISSAVVYMLKTGSVGTQKSLDLNEVLTNW